MEGSTLENSLLTSTFKPTITHIYTQNLTEIQKLCKMN